MLKEAKEKPIFPKLSKLNLPKLEFPQFRDYRVIECPDFDTSADEEEVEEERKEEPSKNILDRIRREDGGIDLGIHKSNFGMESMEVRNTRKMINYDVHEDKLNKEEITKETSTLYEIPFEFGDRGSRWRMMKLEKLGKDPNDEDILSQYATMWDYELACLEMNELKSRESKPRKEWVFKPSEEFCKSREVHIIANNIAMKKLKKNKNDISYTNDDDGNVIEMKKYQEKSKSKKLKNELKLAHLMSMDNEFEDFTISRDQIESLNND